MGGWVTLSCWMVIGDVGGGKGGVLLVSAPWTLNCWMTVMLLEGGLVVGGWPRK